MIDAAAYQTWASMFPALKALPDALAGLLRDELDPLEPVLAVEAVSVGGQHGALVVTRRRVIAVWVSRFLFVLRFPTVQEFHLDQICAVEPSASGRSLRLRAVADPSQPEDGYEDGVFDFASAEALEALRAHIVDLAPGVE